VLKEVTAMVVVGVAVGVPLALALSRIVQSQLFVLFVSSCLRGPGRVPAFKLTNAELAECRETLGSVCFAVSALILVSDGTIAPSCASRSSAAAASADTSGDDWPRPRDVTFLARGAHLDALRTAACASTARRATSTCRA